MTEPDHGHAAQSTSIAGTPVGAQAAGGRLRCQNLWTLPEPFLAMTGEPMLLLMLMCEGRLIPKSLALQDDRAAKAQGQD